MKNNAPLQAALAALLLATTACSSDSGSNATDTPDAATADGGQDSARAQDTGSGNRNDAASSEDASVVDAGVDSGSTQTSADGGLDAGDVVAVDAPQGTADTGPNSATDSAADSGLDATTIVHEAGSDSGRDATADGAVEPPVDAGHEAGHEAGLDGGHEDGSSDGATEAGHDAEADSGHDGGVLSFNTNIWPIVQPVCSGCHGFADGGGGNGVGLESGHLDLSSEQVAYAALLGDGGGVAAAGVSCAALGVGSGLKRVVPANATASLLYNKVVSNDGDGGALLAPDGGPLLFCGSPMPLHQTALSAAHLMAIHDWIEEGAHP